MPFTRPRHWLRWLIGAVVVVAALAAAGPFVTTQDHGLLEFLLVFTKAS